MADLGSADPIPPTQDESLFGWFLVVAILMCVLAASAFLAAKDLRLSDLDRQIHKSSPAFASMRGSAS